MVPSRALFEKVNAFHQATGQPPMAPLRPGLTPTQLRQVVSDLRPHLLQLIDPTIEDWWSWHNGVVLGTIGKSGSYPGVTIDGFCLSTLDRLLESGWSTYQIPSELQEH